MTLALQLVICACVVISFVYEDECRKIPNYEDVIQGNPRSDSVAGRQQSHNNMFAGRRYVLRLRRRGVSDAGLVDNHDMIESNKEAKKGMSVNVGHKHLENIPKLVSKMTMEGQNVDTVSDALRNTEHVNVIKSQTRNTLEVESKVKERNNDGTGLITLPMDNSITERINVGKAHKEVETSKRAMADSRKVSGLETQSDNEVNDTKVKESFPIETMKKKTTTIPPDTPCTFLPSNRSISLFRHNVFYYDLNFVYMRLVPEGNFTITGKEGIIGGTTWTWTFFGKTSGLEFLNWPIEFEIWSMGLLTPYIKGPVEIPIHQARGNCTNLVVGNKESDTMISEALINLPRTLMEINPGLEEKYGPSFLCYKKRIVLNPIFFYLLCKHIVCPVEALEYRCCSNFFDLNVLRRRIDCNGATHKFDSLWWVWPTVVAVVLFTFVPLWLIKCAAHSSDRYHRREHKEDSLANVAVNDEPEERIIYMDDQFPVTLFSTLFDPITKCCLQKCSQSSRTIRFVLPFLTLSFIAIQVVLDKYFLHGFVLESIDAGVPLGFRSITAGFHRSQKNFMPFFGGPFIALSIYLFITCIGVTLPSSLSEFLARGLQDRSEGSVNNSALLFHLRSVETLGSVPVTCHKGYHRIYSTYLGQFYMLLNIKFWKEVWDIQARRWTCFATSRCHYVCLPFYVFICVVEIILCFGINGLPFVSFAVTIVRAYSFFNIFGLRFRSMSIFHKIISSFASVFLVLVVIFFLYMFCTILMDATLFGTRLAIFTYTGIVVYPKLSYGYIIFSFTVFYYLWDCVKNYSMYYWRVLKITVKACEDFQDRHRDDDLILVIADNERHVKGIRESLFEYIIETTCPRRKQVFVSLLKLVIILGIIGGSIGLLRKTDRFQELHVLMHVGTALFTCALPMILKSMCRGPGRSYRNKMFGSQIRRSVEKFAGFYEHEFRHDDIASD